MTAVDPKTGVEIRMGEVLGQIALLPAALRGAFRWMLYDILSHHRTSVLKHQKLQSGRPAQQMLASRMFRYTKVGNDEAKVAEMMGEGFIAAVTASGDNAGYTENPRFFELLEKGGTSDASELRAVPIGAGLIKRGNSVQVSKNFRTLLKEKKFDLVPRRGQLPLLVYSPDNGNRRSVIYGVLTKQITYRPQLGFYKAWDSVLARDISKLEKGIERAATAAGQAALADRDQLLRHGREAYFTKLKAMNANGIRGREAKRAATLAEIAAKKDFISGEATGG